MAYFLNHFRPQDKRLTLATGLTITRIALTPCIVYAMVQGMWTAAFILFITAALTDLFDGILARSLNQNTALGACLDPIADKIFLLSSFFTLAFVPSPLLDIPVWFVILVICKELLVIGGASILLMMGTGLTIQPTWLGKITTNVQIIFIIWLFLCYFFNWLPLKTYYFVLALVTICTAASFVQYARIGLLAKHGDKQ